MLILVGGVFVIETLSVFFQMGTYRLIGRKPLRCSPLHNHFVFRGDPETRIVTRFWIAAILWRCRTRDAQAPHAVEDSPRPRPAED